MAQFTDIYLGAFSLSVIRYLRPGNLWGIKDHVTKILEHCVALMVHVTGLYLVSTEGHVAHYNIAQGSYA